MDSFKLFHIIPQLIVPLLLGLGFTSRAIFSKRLGTPFEFSSLVIGLVGWIFFVLVCFSDYLDQDTFKMYVVGVAVVGGVIATALVLKERKERRKGLSQKTDIND